MGFFCVGFRGFKGLGFIGFRGFEGLVFKAAWLPF